MRYNDRNMKNLLNLFNRPPKGIPTSPEKKGDGSFLEGELVSARKELAKLLDQSDRDENQTGVLRERIVELEKILGKTEATVE